MSDTKVLVIGATGAVGRAATQALTAKGCEVVSASRSSDPGVDLENESSIVALFEKVGTVDAVVCAAGSVPFKPLEELSHDDLLAGYLGKAASQFDLVRIGLPFVSDGGSFTLTTGVLAREPIATGVAAAAANGAVEAYVMAAATELPRGIRINAVSPSVLADAPGYHDAFPGFTPVGSDAVGTAFVRAVLGVPTGRVLTVD